MKRRVLVIDIGGTNVKVMLSRQKRRKFDSGPDMGPRQFIADLKEEVADWKFDVVSVGFPAPLRDGRLLLEPKNLGSGWKRFDWRRAIGKPVRVMNDAAMQALGSYHGGRMLFLGLGTGLGSALIWRDTVLSLELGDLPYLDGCTMEDWLGKDGLKQIGKKHWSHEARRVVEHLQKAMVADYVVLGGGNAKLLGKLPSEVELGHNRNAFLGGKRLWAIKGKPGRQKWNIL